MNRRECHVPAGVKSREAWRITVDLLERCRRDPPHAWIPDHPFSNRDRPRAANGGDRELCSRIVP